MAQRWFRPSRKAVAMAQAAFYVPTGIWPFLHRRSFEAVTGSKKEWWLVQNVGLLALSIGAATGVAGARGRVTDETVLAAAGATASFLAIDAVHLRRGRLKWTYGIDAAAELALLAAWTLAREEPTGSGAAGGSRRSAPAGAGEAPGGQVAAGR